MRITAGKYSFRIKRILRNRIMVKTKNDGDCSMQQLNFTQTVTRYGMDKLLVRHKAVLVAYSGGADSTCLLYQMKELCEKLNITLFAAHINHKIRGASADADEEFCRRTAAALGITLFVLRADVPAMSAERGTGFEETARDIRYAYFDKLAADLSRSYPEGILIATAHQADDNLETVLFHLLRGSGLSGLCGIAPVRDDRYIRPLIADSASDIREWCRDCGIPYVTDETNADPDYMRNKIRIQLTPLLSEYVPDPAGTVSRMTDLLRSDADYLDSEVRKYLNADSQSVERQVLSSLHPALLSRVLRQLYARIRIGHPTLSSSHVDAMIRLLRENPSEGELFLPGNIVYRQDRNTVQIIPLASGQDSPPIPEFSEDGTVWKCGKQTMFFSHNGHPHHTDDDKNSENIYKLSISTSFRFDKIKGDIFVRYRQPGDTYRFGGMTRRVKKLLTDRKLTEEEKNKLPFLCDENGILWIPGFPPRDGTAFRGNGKELIVQYSEEK